MQQHTFDVTIADDQLEAAKAAAAKRGVSLGPAGSLSRDGVTLNYNVEKDDAGGNVVTVTLLHWPFYIPAEDIEAQIEDFLTNPPTDETETPPASTKPASAHTTGKPATVEHGSKPASEPASKPGEHASRPELERKK